MRLAIEVNVIAIYSLANQLPQRTGTGGLNGTRPRPTTISFRPSPSAAAPASSTHPQPSLIFRHRKIPAYPKSPGVEEKKKQTTHFASQSLNYVYESIRSVPPREPSIRFFEQLGSHRRHGVASRRSRGCLVLTHWRMISRCFAPRLRHSSTFSYLSYLDTYLHTNM